VTVWRLARRTFAALDGEGARLYGGRWNRVGQPVVYAAQNLSLAILEVIVHLELALELFPPDYVKIEIDIAADIAVERVSMLPHTASAMLELGAQWYEAGKTAVLTVPSVIVTEECNVLLNPGHRDFAKVRRARPRPFRLDTRLVERN
jgi:RES domain-containing protein